MKRGVLPTQVAEVMEQGRRPRAQRGLRAALTAHAGVGIVTAALAGERRRRSVVATLAEWRELVAGAGGHASGVGAARREGARAVWDDAGAAGRIMQGIKAQLDPSGILNPGRFVGASRTAMAHAALRAPAARSLCTA